MKTWCACFVAMQDDAEAMITASVCGGDRGCIMSSLDALGHADAAAAAASMLSSGTVAGGGSSSGNGSSGGNGGGEGVDGGGSIWEGSVASWRQEQDAFEGSWERRAGGSAAVAEAAAPADLRALPGRPGAAAAELTLDLDSWQQVGRLGGGGRLLRHLAAGQPGWPAAAAAYAGTAAGCPQRMLQGRVSQV